MAEGGKEIHGQAELSSQQWEARLIELDRGFGPAIGVAKLFVRDFVTDEMKREEGLRQVMEIMYTAGQAKKRECDGQANGREAWREYLDGVFYEVNEAYEKEEARIKEGEANIDRGKAAAKASLEHSSGWDPRLVRILEGMQGKNAKQ